jgi:hypothetical protein
MRIVNILLGIPPSMEKFLYSVASAEGMTDISS